MSPVRRGPDHPKWQGGRSETYLHSLYSVDGKTCERCGTPDDIVRHHKDEDRTNNKKSNIEFLCRGCHTAEHHTGKQVRQETREKISASAMGNQKWLGRKHSEESKKKMSQAQKNRTDRVRDSDGRFV